ncbi:MAG: TolC family protein [Kofleriaceae bacterium]
MFAAASNIASADEPPPPEAIDEDALIAAIERSDPRVERIAADIDAVAASVDAARLRAEPRLVIDREEVFPSGGGVATQYVRLVLPIDLSGRRGRRVDAATANARAARAEAEIDRFALVVDGLRVFRGAGYARLRVALLSTERTALVRALEIVRKRAGAGDASGYDVQRLQLELTTYDDSITAATIDLRTAQRRLAALLGRSGSLVNAASELPLPTPPAIDKLRPDALARRGDYRAAKLRIDAAKSDASAARRTWVPTLELTAGAMSADLGTETARGYVAGLSFSLPIFDRGRAAGTRADAARRAAVADTRVLERRVPEAIQIALEAMTARADQARAFQTTQLARLDLLLRSAETGYREGGGGIVELLDAYRAVRDARLHDLELRRDASLAELDLWLAVGRRP